MSPETHRDMQAARTASMLCAAASLVTVIGLLLPHPPEIEERGVAAVALGAAGLALLLRLAFGLRSGRRSSAAANTAVSSRSRSASIVAPWVDGAL